ncbi:MULTISPECIES: rod shape-determining protein RodA [Rufibacter]|uniref:Rod shape determining protein RodA n=1 Tax=Rufibacter quisquiliarum TaxID=1549639 RepID=A0A839GK37_9BACT|nr:MULTISPECIES: rod shape-determining protein RodA [Rufibacter]MBA9078123.1 rod shape determining protein RodA [Rufibacter quisquiliarum]
MRTSYKLTQNIDWITIGLYALMVILGWMNIYAAVYNPENVTNIFDFSLNSGKQLVWIGASVVIIVMLFAIDYKAYDSLAYVIYWFFILLLLGTLAFASEIKGSRSWLVITESIRLQPAEFAKFATALAVSKFMSSINLRQQNWKDQAKLAGLALLPPTIIILQNETGSALVFAAFTLAFFREGMSPLILIIGAVGVFVFVLTLLIPQWYLAAGVTVLMAAYGWFNFHRIKRFLYPYIGIWVAVLAVVFSVNFFVENVLQEHQRNRIKVLVDPDIDPLGVGWNVTQSKIAIGSGGFLGKGFLEGTQTKFDFVPEQSTDFIFCTVGEEHGWIGSLVLIALFMGLLIRIITVAERQRSVFGRTYGYCVASIIFFHFLVNVGMTIGLAPVVGIPLPFFSYGGSGLWSFTILLFILLAIDAHRKLDLGR